MCQSIKCMYACSVYILLQLVLCIPSNLHSLLKLLKNNPLSHLITAVCFSCIFLFAMAVVFIVAPGKLP